LTHFKNYNFAGKKEGCVTWHLRGSRGTLIYLKNILKMPGNTLLLFSCKVVVLILSVPDLQHILFQICNTFFFKKGNRGSFDVDIK